MADKLPADVKKGTIDLSVSQDGKSLLTYYTLFEVGQFNDFLDPVEPQDPNKFIFVSNFNPAENQLLIKGDSYYLPDPKAAKSLHYQVVPEGGGKPVVEGEIKNVAEYYFQDVVTLPALKPGKYNVEAYLTLNDGKKLGPMSSDDRKEGRSQGLSRLVGQEIRHRSSGSSLPSPPLRTKGNTFKCWGREYTLNAMGLPDAVKSQNEAVLTSSRADRGGDQWQGRDDQARCAEDHRSDRLARPLRRQRERRGTGVHRQGLAGAGRLGLCGPDLPPAGRQDR